ncbi:MAG: UDP-3-O-(3-hydroxymyristoyl)glucosamine N-acyltransferase [Deltaproteobacteria bacterium]
MFTIKEISELIGGTVIGEPDIEITSVNNIENAGKGSISFIASEEYLRYLENSEASAIIVPDSLNLVFNGRDMNYIVVENVYKSLALLLKAVENESIENNGINPLSYVSPDALLDESVAVGAFTYISEKAEIAKGVRIASQVFIGKNVKIGINTLIYPGVKIYNGCTIGNNCIIHSNSVIGSDGFSFKPDKAGVFEKIPHLGNVLIEDNVEIGSNTVVDRATFGSTILRKGVKLDNLIQVAHNVEIGNDTVIAAQTGIAGSTKIGQNVMIGGQVGFKNHLKIADGSKFQAQSGIIQDITEGNKLYQGSPAIDYINHMKSSLIFKNLPHLQKKLNELEKEIEKLKKQIE